jgi:hypothetical protein
MMREKGPGAGGIERLVQSLRDLPGIKQFRPNPSRNVSQRKSIPDRTLDSPFA